MAKPNSIRIVQLLLYFKLALFAFILIVATLLLVVPDGAWSGWNEYKANTITTMFGFDNPEEYRPQHLGVVAVNLAPSILGIILTLVAIARKKRMLAIVLSLVVFWFSSNNPLQLLLSLIIVVLLLLRPARLYFEGAASAPGVSPGRQAAPIDVTGEAAEDEADAVPAASAGTSARDKLPDPQPAANSEPKPRANPDIEIRNAGPEDADELYAVTQAAFEEYRVAVPPSSALEETAGQIRALLEEEKEFAGILYEDETAVGAVRYRFEGNAVVFSRLSVVPSRRKRGYARKLMEWGERQGVAKGAEISRCKVRQTVHKNLVMYENMGYEVADQELVVRPAGTVKFLTLEKPLGPK
ncbi:MULTISPECIES: GNAT family N-acetyltransferase [Cohnella]|uniref:GNAT family N-acetyltransferase n=1 Tax=Cohnella TaxID=329857 RepID=UPI0009BAC3B4|nr:MULTISPECIES: GNAT family N-acetyltransferase [Cohnella]MBN2980026.1 GNAT family N-acetyltransferase [Cohnella algarum]